MTDEKKEHLEAVHANLGFVCAALELASVPLQKEENMSLYIIEKAHESAALLMDLFSGPDPPTLYAAKPDKTEKAGLN